MAAFGDPNISGYTLSINNIAHVYSKGKIEKIMKYAQDTWCDKTTKQMTDVGKVKVKGFINWLFKLDNNACVQPGSWKFGDGKINFKGEK